MGVVMNPPPLAADLIGAGLVLNYGRSLRNRARAKHGLPPKVTVSRYVCRHKGAAVCVAVVGSCWLTAHWARYVIDESVGGSA